MNWSKAKTTLSSINRLIAIFEEADDLSTIERDLLLKKIQELYELFLLSNIKGEQEKKVNPTVRQPIPPPVIVEKPKIEQAKAVVIETPKPIAKPKVEERPVYVEQREKPQAKAVVEIPKPISKPKVEERPVYVEQKEKPQAKAVVEAPKPISKPKVEERPVYVEQKEKPQAKVVSKVTISEQNIDDEIADLFEFKSATDLSEKLSDAPIKDLKASMSINERFLTISELFKGNAARYNEVVEVLNGLSNFDQAKSYLIKVVIPEFDWTAEKKQDLVKRFIKKVNRRFL